MAEAGTRRATLMLPSLGPDDGRYRGRPELPPVPKSRRPVGYQPGLRLEERLIGLLLVIVGLLGLGGTYLVYAWSGTLDAGPVTGGAPVPIVAPVLCLLPLVALGSIGLVLVGVRQMVDP